MLDVSFLLKPDLTQTIIYRYQTGIFVPRVRRCIGQLLDAQGGGLNEVEPGMLAPHVMSPSLFDQFTLFCNWPLSSSTRKRVEQAEDVLDIVGRPEARQFILFARNDAVIFQLPLWNEAITRCLFLEEPTVSERTLAATLTYYAAATDLPYCPVHQMHLQDVLLSRFVHSGFPSLDEFLKEVDRTLLVDYDARSGRFDEVSFHDRQEDRSYVLRPLRLVIEGRTHAIVSVLEGLEVRLRQKGISAHEVLRDLLDISRDLLSEIAVPGRGSSESGLESRTVLWSLAILVASEQLQNAATDFDETLTDQADTFLVNIDFLCRDFQRRLSGHIRNPVADWWPALERILSRFANDSSTSNAGPDGRIILALHAYQSRPATSAPLPAWARRLSAPIATAVAIREKRIIEADEFADREKRLSRTLAKHR